MLLKLASIFILKTEVSDGTGQGQIKVMYEKRSFVEDFGTI